jgi:hypothetical protein
VDVLDDREARPDGEAVEARTMGPIDCANRFGVTLRFRRWLGVEEPLADRASILAGTDPTDLSLVWQNTGEVNDCGWSAQEVDLSSIADDEPAVYVRWVMGPTNGVHRFCGWNIDDIGLWSHEGREVPTGIEEPRAPRALRIESVLPNPFNPAATIRFTLPSAAFADLSVYDLLGRLVKVLLHERREAGAGAVVWGGDDSRGRPVAAGVYFARLRAGDEVSVRKMVLLK